MQLCTSKHSTERWKTTSKNLVLDCCCCSRTADGVSVRSVLHTSSLRWERAFENPVCPFVLLIKNVKKTNIMLLPTMWPEFRGRIAQEVDLWKAPIWTSKSTNDAFMPKYMNLTERRKWDIKFHVTNIWKRLEVWQEGFNRLIYLSILTVGHYRQMSQQQTLGLTSWLMDLMCSFSIKNVNTFSSGSARSPSDVRIMQITPAMLLISVTAVKLFPPRIFIKYDKFDKYLQWKVVHPKVPAWVTVWLLIILRTRKSNKLHIVVFMYSEWDWSTGMGGFTIAPADIWSVHCLREERNMRWWGDDRSCVRIHQGHRYGRETD